MCCHHDLVIATVHQVYLTNLEQRQSGLPTIGPSQQSKARVHTDTTRVHGCQKRQPSFSTPVYTAREHR